MHFINNKNYRKAPKGRHPSASGIAPRNKPHATQITLHLKPPSMSQSLVKNYLHICFSTKHRQKLITEKVEHEIHNYLGGVCKHLNCQPLIVGGFDDHVHILCMLSKKITLIKLLEELKSNSSKWIKTIDQSLQHFYWQDGYGAFSVNPSETETVIKYISNQRTHHNSISFQDELRSFLKKYKVDYDERYLWD
jgi:putative transposase